MYFKVLENNNKKYVYDFTLLTAEQSEIAREAAEFKYNQSQMEPESFKAVLKSNGAEWLFVICSYLFVEIKEDKPQEFNIYNFAHLIHL
jgi:hypothetical protein